MKQALFGFVLGTVTIATVAQAGLWDQLATMDWPVKESSAFKVEAYGFDFRVYEWQTENDPNTFCTVAIGNADHAPYMGLDCFQKSN
jgi:hypothetical protein